MRWSRFVAVLGVVAGASFATYDEAQNLLATCEVQSQDGYARLLILSVLFGMHGMILSVGALLVLKYTRSGRGALWRVLEIAITVSLALVVGLGMAIADPVLNFVVAIGCTALVSCVEPGFARSLSHVAQAAVDWPNTPVAVFMVTLFGLGAFSVQALVERERATPGRRSVDS